jgi:phosphate:Na+ symporter
MEHGFVLSDILTNLKRIADHCSNIAGVMLRLSQSETPELHKYLKGYRKSSPVFDLAYREYRKKYALHPE